MNNLKLNRNHYLVEFNVISKEQILSMSRTIEPDIGQICSVNVDEAIVSDYWLKSGKITQISEREVIDKKIFKKVKVFFIEFDDKSLTCKGLWLFLHQLI